MSQKKTAKVHWSQEAEEVLFANYEAHPCLYNSADKDYHNKNRRARAIGEITYLVKEHIPNITSEAVKNKLEYSRKQFRNELEFFRQQSINDGAEGVYESDHWWFERLLFLAEHLKTRTSLLNIDVQKHKKRKHEQRDDLPDPEDQLESMEVFPSVEYDQFDAEESLDPNTSADNKRIEPLKFTPMIPVKRSRSKNSEELVNKMANCEAEENPLDLFCKFITSEMKSIKDRTVLAAAKRRIQITVMDAIEEDTTKESCIKSRRESSD